MWNDVYVGILVDTVGVIPLNVTTNFSHNTLFHPFTTDKNWTPSKHKTYKFLAMACALFLLKCFRYRTGRSKKVQLSLPFLSFPSLILITPIYFLSLSSVNHPSDNWLVWKIVPHEELSFVYISQSHKLMRIYVSCNWIGSSKAEVWRNERSTENQTNIGAIWKGPVMDGVECVWAFPNAQIPSWLKWNAFSFYRQRRG